MAGPRLLVPFLLLMLSAPAFAIYKCEQRGATVYSDRPCPGAQVLPIDATTTGAGGAGKRQLAQEKAELEHLQAARHKREAAARKKRLRAAKAAEARRKKCATLALRRRWAHEDAAGAGLKQAAAAQRKARRADESYQAACG